MSTEKLPPPAPAGGVFREQVRTALHGWDTMSSFVVVLSLPVLFLGAFLTWYDQRPDLPAWDFGGLAAVWKHDPALGAGHLVAMAAVLAAGASVWRPRGTPMGLDEGWWGGHGAGRAAILGQPVGRRRHEVLRAAGGAVWVLPIAWLALGVGAAVHLAVTGDWPVVAAGDLLGILAAPLAWYLLISAAFVRLSGWMAVAWVAGGFTIAAGLGSEWMWALPSASGALEGVLLGELGLVTGLAGGSWAGALLWSGVGGALLYARAGRLPDSGHWWWRGGRESRVRGHEPARAEELAARRMPAPLWEVGPPSGLLPPRPSLPATLSAHVRSLRDSFTASYVFVAIATAIWIGIWDGTLFGAEARSTFLAQGPMYIRWAGIALVFCFCVGDTPRLAPGTFVTLGAAPFSRRGWIVSRVGTVTVGVVSVALAAQVALGIAGWAAGHGLAGAAGPAALAQTAGLIVVAGLLTGAWVSRLANPMVLLLPAAIVLPVGLFILLMAADELLQHPLGEALLLRGAFGGRLTAAGAAALLGWILLSGTALWLAAGRRSADARAGHG